MNLGEEKQEHNRIHVIKILELKMPLAQHPRRKAQNQRLVNRQKGRMLLWGQMETADPHVTDRISEHADRTESLTIALE